VARLVLVDGSNHAFRVQFALPPQHASDGTPTRVLYGFTLLFQKLLRTLRPDYVAVAFDSGRTFRHELHAAYKGHRPDMPEDLRAQWPWLPKLVEGFGYAVVRADGFEADDVLGTLAARFAGPDLEVLVVTSDKDFAQLVGDHVKLLDESKGVVYGPDEVVQRWGVRPAQIVDLLGLAGDSSDNIPGVAGVGDKTAAQLLERFGTLEAVLDAADRGEVAGKRGETLRASRSDAELSRRLATIRTDVPLPHALADLAPRGLVEASLRPLFERWEFGAVARKLLPTVHVVDPTSFRLVRDEAEAVEVLDAVRAAGRCGLAVGFHGDRAVDLGVSWAGGTAWISLVDRGGHAPGANAAALALALVADEGVQKVVHDAKALDRALRRGGHRLCGVVGDPRLLDYVLVAHRRQHGLEDLAQRLLGHTLRILPDPEPLDAADIGLYWAEAAFLALALHDRLADRLEDGTRFVYDQIERPLLPVLVAMEDAGIGLDLARLSAIRDDIGARVVEAERVCQELAGRPFKPGSPKDAADVLYEELGLPKTKKNPSGGWSTDSAVLEQLVDIHPLPQALLDYRALQKLEGTYLAKLPEYVGPDGRIHTVFQQAVAATGRLASTDPNLQNIPVRSFEGRRIREAFVPAPDHVFVSADYSQIELRVLAHLTGSEALASAFRRGEDIHRRTAAEVFGVAIEAVTAEQRTAAKAINFGLLYGMGAFRLSRELGISRAMAAEYVDAYFARLPEVAAWAERVRATCRSTGRVETLYGRRRLIPEAASKNHQERTQGEREAVNTVVQGTAADLIKLAMIRVHAALEGTSARLLLQVHDELLVETREEDAADVGEVLRAEMSGVAALAVPLEVTVALGRTWAEAHG
jgi:DNA polymerase-1